MNTWAMGQATSPSQKPARYILALKDDDGETQVLVVPVTHSPPDNLTAALELPRPSEQHLGFDAEQLGRPYAARFQGGFVLRKQVS
jgi:hypothetical protein